MKKISRNSLCPCGSGKKYKLCCAHKNLISAANPHSIETGGATITTKLNLAIKHHQGGRITEAEILYQQILEEEPGHADALNLSGLIAHQQGNNDIAIHLITKAINAKPSDQHYYYNLGVVLQAQDRIKEAITCYRQALAIQPDYIEVYPNLGAALQTHGQPDEAIVCYLQALSIRPNDAKSYSNLGLALQAKDRLEEAITCFKQALSIQPDYAEAYSNLGVALQAQGRLDETVACFRQALLIKPNYAKAYYDLGTVLPDQGWPDDAITCYRHALLIQPDYAQARFNLALILLKLEQFDEGWICYEARFDKNKPNRSTEIPDLPCPRWLGENLHDKSIIVWPEQGMGDEIQSVRFIPLLKKLGATKVTLVCKSPLKALFQSLSDADLVIAESEAAQLAGHDFWIFQMSLPMHFKTNLETIPDRLPYLAADETKQKYWSEQLPADRLKVGLVWKGSEIHQNDAKRSLPGLATLAPLWSVPGISFISLQKGQGEDEASHPPAGQPLIHLGSQIKDFSDSAAIVSQLDLVICVDTAMAHLTGALGKPCWVLLPSVGTDWRWLKDREDSPWYPGSIRLFRQMNRTDWNETVAQMVDALVKFRHASSPFTHTN